MKKLARTTWLSLTFGALVFGMVGCSDNNPANPDGGPDGGGDASFTAFVINMITTETREDNQPVDIDSVMLSDNEDPAAYDVLFQ